MASYLASDLGATRLGLLSLDQREADGEDQEEGQEKVTEVHGCELSLLEGAVRVAGGA